MLKKAKVLLIEFWFLYFRNITKQNIVKINKKQRINNPLSGSFAKVCTELSIPDLTKKVPDTLNKKVEKDKIKIHDVNKFFFSRINKEWIRAVKQIQGIKDTFSTGSQNQKPPHPNS